MYNDTIAGLEAYMDDVMTELGTDDTTTDTDAAQEGFFGPRPVAKLLAKVQKNVDKKCKTTEDCDDMLAKIKEEEAKFNENIGIMATARKKYDAGEIDKKALVAEVTPCIKDLKTTCKMLNLSDFAKDPKDITEDELSNLKAFIVGTRDIIRAKKTSITVDGSDKVVASESDIFGGLLIEDDEAETPVAEEGGETAEEGALYGTAMTLTNNASKHTYKVLRTIFKEKADEAKPVVKKAKGAAKAKDYAEAIKLYTQAKNIYESGIKEIGKIDPKLAKALREKGEQTTKISTIGMSKSLTEKVDREVWPSSAALTFKHRIAACDEAIVQLKLKMRKQAASEGAIGEFMCEMEMAMEEFGYDSEYEDENELNDGLSDDDFDVED